MSVLDDRFEAARALRDDGAFAEAVAAYDSLARDLEDAFDLESRVAGLRALRLKGAALSKLERFDEEMGIYDLVVERAGAAIETPLRLEVARSLNWKVSTLDDLGRHEDVLRVCEVIVQRDADASDSELRACVAEALVDRGNALGKLDRRDEQLAAYGRVAQREDEATELVLREWVVYALDRQAHVLDKLGRHDDEVRVHELIVEREGAAQERDMQKRVARQFVTLGITYDQLDRHEDALATYDETIKRYRHAADADLTYQASRALSLKAETLEGLGRNDEALATYDALVNRYGTSSDDRVRLRVARAVVTRSATLWTRGDTEGALEAARAMPRFEEPISAKLAEVMARARVNEGMCLAKLHHFGDARATFEGILALTVDPDDDGLIEDVLRAAYNNALALKELRCPDEALECSRVTIERFRNSPGTHARPVLASVMLSYGRDLVAHGRESEAMSIFDELLVLLDASDSDTLHANYAHAQTERAKILQGRGDLMGAADAHRAVFDRFSVVSDGYPAHAAAWAGVAAMRLLSKGRRPDELTAIAQAVRARYRGSKDPYLRARVRNVSVVAIMMPPANRAIDAVERRPRAYALAAATASVAAAAAWARRRARRP